MGLVRYGRGCIYASCQGVFVRVQVTRPAIREYVIEYGGNAVYGRRRAHGSSTTHWAGGQVGDVVITRRVYSRLQLV
ncbi:hypothetical protein BDN72DRAFT_830806 [Pluteus cervinus]|uniref:Uncharacterized protein n=1 Tax=Pluteus cervinus TaxID=181527 RepID=A0ACD3BF69_9AGAR|nr:hypothetical protein BDN72DRAFT_830806 [Pluteus cervinus]